MIPARVSPLVPEPRVPVMPAANPEGSSTPNFHRRNAVRGHQLVGRAPPLPPGERFCGGWIDARPVLDGGMAAWRERGKTAVVFRRCRNS